MALVISYLSDWFLAFLSLSFPSKFLRSSLIYVIKPVIKSPILTLSNKLDTFFLETIILQSHELAII